MNGRQDAALELQSVNMEGLGNEQQGLLPAHALRPSAAGQETPATTIVVAAADEDMAAEDELAAEELLKERAAANSYAGSTDKERQASAEIESGLSDGKRPDEHNAFLIGHQRSASLGHNRGPSPRGIKPLKELTPWTRYYAVAIFTLTASMLYADQNLMAPLLTPIAAEFGFNDEEKDRYLGGYIAFPFFFVGALSAVLVGYLCDRMSRRNLLFIVVLLGEGPCLATYFVRHYWQLLLLRILTGISVGGTLPLVYSLVGDLFDVGMRAAVAAGIQVATGVGLASGQAISGFAGPHTGWRWPFVIVAVPALLLATIMILTTSDPPRGAAESALQEQYENVEGFVYQEKLDWGKLKRMVATPSNICVIMQGLPGSLPWGVLLTFLNDFLARDQHLSIGVATAVLLCWGVGGGVGVIGGGLVGQLLYLLNPAFMPVFVCICVCSATPPMWFLVNADVSRISLFWSFAAAFVGGALSSPPGPNARAVLLNVNEPEGRGFALGLMTVLDDIGKGTGPFVVSELITYFGRRRPAFNIAIGAWIPCGLIFAGAAFTLRRDENAMQERLRSKVLLQPVCSSEETDLPSPEDEMSSDAEAEALHS